MSRAPSTLSALLILQAVIVAGQVPPFRAETRLVVLHATVTNGRGELMTNLDQGAFTVQENSRRQPITLFRRDDVPISVGLLIDNSGSMRLLRAKVEAAALAFARASNPDDEIFVVNFADTVHLDVPMTRDLQVLEAGIARVDSIGGTSLRDAVDLGERYLSEHATKDRRVLLVITDGKDNASMTSADRIREQAERSQTTIHAIGLVNDRDAGGGGAGRHELTEMTTRTGGVGVLSGECRAGGSRRGQSRTADSPSVHGGVCPARPDARWIVPHYSRHGQCEWERALHRPHEGWLPGRAGRARARVVPAGARTTEMVNRRIVLRHLTSLICALGAWWTVTAQELAFPSTATSVKFAAIGDAGTGKPPQYDIANQMTRFHAIFPFDRVLMLGDNIYGRQGPSDLLRKFAEPYQPLLDRGVTFFASLGNHDDPANRRYLSLPRIQFAPPD